MTAIYNVNNDEYNIYQANAGSTQAAASIYNNPRSTQSVGTTSSTSNAGTEDLKKDKKVDLDYIKATLNKLLQGRTLRYRDPKNNTIKTINIDDILQHLQQNKKFDINKLLNMTKNEFNVVVKCIKAAIEDSVDKDGIIDTKKAFRNFTAYTIALKNDTSDTSIDEKIEKIRKDLKEEEKKSVEEKLGITDINDEEKLVEALKEFLKTDELEEKLSKATTDEEKKAILKEEIYKVLKLVHGASDDDMMKIGAALLKAVKGTGMVLVLDVVADMLIPSGMREKFIQMINDKKEILIKYGNFTEDELRELSAYLAKNGSFDKNQENLDKINESLQKLKPAYEKVKALREAYIAEQISKGRKREEITEDEINKYLLENKQATEEELQQHNEYILRQAELEGATAGIIGNTDLDKDEIDKLIKQAHKIAKEQGFEDEFLKAIKDYIKEHGSDYELSQDEINNILNKATDNQFNNITGGLADNDSQTNVQTGNNNAFTVVTQERVEAAAAKKEELQKQILEQSDSNSNDFTIIPAANGTQTFYRTKEAVAKTLALSYTNAKEAVCHVQSKKEFRELANLYHDSIGNLVGYTLTAQDASSRAISSAAEYFCSLLSGTKDQIGEMNLTSEGILALSKNKSNLKHIELSDKQKKQFGLDTEELG